MSDDQTPWPRWFDDRPPPGTVEWTPSPSPPPEATPPSPPPLAPRRDLDTATVRLRPARRPRCLECGGTVDADGYCQTCGARVPTPREHYEAAPATWLAGVSDRGVTHVRNEDALALWVAPAPRQRAVLVVCDGVSTAEQSDVAALAAAERARDVLAGRSGDTPVGAAPEAALTAAVAAANAAVIEHTEVDTTNAPACTIAAALVDGPMIHVANVGDSRVYWIGSTERLIVSTDHSLAGERIAAGESRSVAEHAPGAHAITRWLGLDAENPTPTVAGFAATEDGWLVVCSDGLWNYASDPADLAAALADAAAGTSDPLTVARRLVAWANAQGGKDNVTVGLAYVRANLQIRSATPTTER